MAITNYTLPFNIHNTQKMPIRNRPAKYAESNLAERAVFEVSEGQRPAEYLGVYRYLPVLQQDVTTKDFIVLPKGRIVAAVSSEDSTPSGAMVTPSGDGSVYTFTSAIDSTITSVGIDDSYFGYDEYINGLLVPCNGGTANTASGVWYTANDVTAGTLLPAGTAATAGTAFALPANMPIGVVYHDWFQDIRGQYLNYAMWQDGGNILCDWFVQVPYVKVNAAGHTPVVTNTTSYVSYLDKYSVNKKFTYLAVNNGTDIFRPGVFVYSDQIGNYKIQGGASAATQTKNTQTVGRLLGIDNRFPKSGLEDVQTYPGSGMPGTQTAGLPKFLFDFVTAVMSLDSATAPSVETVYDLVRAGYFGVARIQLMVA